MKLTQVILAVMALAITTGAPSSAVAADFTSEFGLNRSDLTSAGLNPYFILNPGYPLSQGRRH